MIEHDGDQHDPGHAGIGARLRAERERQGLTLEDVQSRMKASDWWERFPPAGVRIVSWTVAMGLGQIVTLELPPHLLPAVNLELERSAWGVFTTACYPSYDVTTHPP